MRIVFDIGSAASLPDKEAIRNVVDAVAAKANGRGDVYVKAQLFTDIPPNKPLSPELFRYLYDYATERGIGCSSSVFDEESLRFLLGFDPPFVKIACRPDLYGLAGSVPRRTPLFVSYDCRTNGQPPADFPWKVDVSMACVPEYPAGIEDYSRASRFGSISDHTEGLALFLEFRGDVYEKHLCLARSPGNPDSGPFALSVAEGDLDRVFAPSRANPR